MERRKVLGRGLQELMDRIQDPELYPLLPTAAYMRAQASLMFDCETSLPKPVVVRQGVDRALRTQGRVQN